MEINVPATKGAALNRNRLALPANTYSNLRCHLTQFASTNSADSKATLWFLHVMDTNKRPLDIPSMNGSQITLRHICCIHEVF